jgi:hypothetical protein
MLVPGIEKGNGRVLLVIFYVIVKEAEGDKVGDFSPVVILFDKLVGDHEIYHGVLGDGDFG